MRPGSVTLDIACTGANHAPRPAAANVVVAAETTTAADLEAQATGGVSGVVRDGRTGLELENACASLVAGEGFASEVVRYAQAPHGTFVMTDVPPGTYRLLGRSCGAGPDELGEAWAPGTDFAAAALIHVTPAATSAVDVTLHPIGYVAGVVTDADGDPVGNGNIELATYGERWGRSVPLASDGSYRLPAGRGGYQLKLYQPTWRFSSYSNGTANRSAADGVSVAPGSTADGSFAAPPTATISGVAVLAGTLKPKPCGIAARDPSDPTQFGAPFTHSSPDGAFQLPGLAPGDYVVHACNARVATMHVSAGQDRANVQLVLPVRDSDADGHADSIDNCPFTINRDQADADGDDFGDTCDPANSVSASVTDVVERSDGTTFMHVAVSLDTRSTDEVTARVRTEGGTATPGDDYSALDETITIPAGALSSSTSIAVFADRSIEPDETVGVEIVASSLPIANGLAFGRIVNDDTELPQIRWQPFATAMEESGQLIVQASLSRPAAEPVSFRCVTADGSAVAGSDYVATDETIEIPPGYSEARCVVPLLDDDLVEESETLSVTMSDLAGVELGGDATSSAEIHSSDTGPKVELLVERVGAEPNTSALFVVTLDRPSINRTEVQVVTRTTGAKEGLDFVRTERTLGFQPGDTRMTVAVPILDDEVFDPDDYVALEIVSATNEYAVYGGVSHARIVDDDPVPKVTASNTSVREGDAGAQHSAVFTLTLDRLADVPTWLNVATSPAGATADVDYASVDKEVRFDPGERSLAVPVSIYGDTIYEGGETFLLELVAYWRAEVGGSATAQIDNDDCVPRSLDLVRSVLCDVYKATTGDVPPPPLHY